MTLAPTLRRRPSRLSARRRREIVFGVLLLLYAALTISIVIYPSPVLQLDEWWRRQDLWGRYPQYYSFVHTYVMFGQRGPATLTFLPVFGYLAYRRRSTEPLVALLTALLLLNASVGLVKYVIGRTGPLKSPDPYRLFVDGTLYPSGHVSNAVVLYGVIAMLVPRYRKWLVAGAVFLCLTVGFGTIYLQTHWFSDVVAGWIAGALVLVALPEVQPYAQRWADRALVAVREGQRRRRARALLDRRPDGAGRGPREPAVVTSGSPGEPTPLS